VPAGPYLALTGHVQHDRDGRRERSLRPSWLSNPAQSVGVRVKRRYDRDGVGPRCPW
jgi:hypothetical protein